VYTFLKLKKTVFYKTLIHRIKLKKFWTLFNTLDGIYRFNYKFVNTFYLGGCFIDYKVLLNNIKKILPLFLKISLKNGKFLFVTTKWLYSKTVCKESTIYIENSTCQKLNNIVFSNFSFYSFKFIEKLSFKLNPVVLVFFSIIKNDFLILGAKKKDLPIIALTSLRLNTFLIDYPLVINTEYFHSIYFFSKLLFKLFFMKKQ